MVTAPDRLPRLGDDPTAEITASDPAISAYLTERNAARPRGSPPLSWDAMVRAAAWLREGSPTVREALAALEGAPPAPTTDAPTP